jgi:thiosulfate reductase cytochrome b subunit
MKLHNLFGIALLLTLLCFATSALMTNPYRKDKYAFSGFLSGSIGIFLVFASALKSSKDEDEP